jgi:hypothetical protein
MQYNTIHYNTPTRFPAPNETKPNQTKRNQTKTKSSPQEAREYAQQMDLIFMETSAKTNQNVREVFQDIAERLPIPESNEDSGGIKVRVLAYSRKQRGQRGD